MDALWEKYRSLSPYHYAANDPLRLKDPSGFKIDFSATQGDQAAIQKAREQVDEAISYLVENGAEAEAQILIELRDSKQMVVKIDVLPESVEFGG